MEIEESMEIEEREEVEQRGNIFQRLITDVILFQIPKLDANQYKNISLNFTDKLIFIERNKECKTSDDYIPCLFYKRKTSSNYLIYFHGNSENVFQIENYGLDFRSYLDMNIIMVEYPGYFIKSNNNPDSNIIFKNSLIVYDWIKSTFNALDENIFVCGRSLGTSPAIYLSHFRKPKALFLISAFTSMKSVASEITFISLESFVEPIFQSINYIVNVKCPILLIHGMQDKLIRYTQSQILYDTIKGKNKNSDLILIPNMTHNDYNLKEDIIDRIKKFCNEKNLLNNDNIINDNIINNNINNDNIINENIINNIKISDNIINDNIINDNENYKDLEKKKINNGKEQKKEKENERNKKAFEELKERNLHKIPLAISRIIDLFIFELEKFDIRKSEIFDLENASVLKGLFKEKIAIINGSKISIYNDRIYLDYEINLADIKNHDVKISSIYQIKNGNIICSTKEGDIFIIKLNKKEYEIIKTITMKEEIFKIDDFFDDNIILLSKNYLKIYDSTFSKEIYSLDNDNTFDNFCLFSNNILVLKRQKFIQLYEYNKNLNNNLSKIKEKELNLKTSDNIMIGTDKYLIISDLGKLLFLENDKCFETEERLLSDKFEEITFISKIHDEFLLASTDKGSILQINGKKEIFKKNIINMKIKSVLMIDCETLIISGNNKIIILSSEEKEESNNKKNNEKCLIY